MSLQKKLRHSFIDDTAFYLLTKSYEKNIICLDIYSRSDSLDSLVKLVWIEFLRKRLRAM